MSTAHLSCKVVFQPSGKTRLVPFETTISQAAALAGLAIHNPCGGQGTCGKCRVIVHSGDCPPSSHCREILTARQLERGARLACKCQIQSDAVVEIPFESLIDQPDNKILTAGESQAVEVSPAVYKRFFNLPAPTSEDDISDLERLARELDLPLFAHLPVLRELPGFLRENAFSGTALLRNGDQLLGLEAGDTEDTCYGVAFDIGTTTLVGTLIHLPSGQEKHVVARMNPQIPVGDDVITRIQATRQTPPKLAEMRKAIIGTVNEILAELAAGEGISIESIYEIVLAGNTTMQHILCGVSPAALGEVPFPPVFRRGLALAAADLGVTVNPKGVVFVFPNIGGFVGGDTVAGILAASLDTADKPVVLVDIGTNGEIVLAHDGGLMATSTAAGPAFEGARITHGMRAADGAIEKIWFADGDVRMRTVGDEAPVGLCGTALIDLTAVLLDLGVVDITGRILEDGELPESLPEAVRKRIIRDEAGVPSFALAFPEQTTSGEGVLLFQRDLRELQLASGAIRAGVSIMIRQAGLTVDDISEVLLAGAFGNYIRRENACRIGLLPDLPVERIRFIGNAASGGAKMALLSGATRKRAEAFAGKVEHIDLSSDPDFQMEFGMAMMFPGEEF
ncbi:MAG: ASKHA domain-containing protein [Lentisphaeria bacterium]|nr:ASKHA domain-containing protein [Lentisphaeria bacterium]